jgi:hypothetical protein
MWKLWSASACEKNVVTCEVIEGNEMSSVKFLRVSGYGPAQHENQSTGRCLGRRPGTRHKQTRPVRHDGPWRANPHWAVPTRWPSTPTSLRTGYEFYSFFRYSSLARHHWRGRQGEITGPPGMWCRCYSPQDWVSMRSSQDTVATRWSADAVVTRHGRHKIMMPTMWSSQD